MPRLLSLVFALMTLGAVSLTVSPANAQRGCAVTVFEHDNFNGASFESRQDVPFVGDRWNDRISSIVVQSGVWEFFEHARYRGASFRLGPGERPSMGRGWNDRISSFRCVGDGRRAEQDRDRGPRGGRGCSVRLFEHDGFRGASFDARRDVPFVGERWNDQISSIIVEGGVWEFYEHINYGGASFRLGPGERPSVGRAWNDRISSFRCVG